MRKIKEYVFHSRDLLPYKVSVYDREMLIRWMEDVRPGYRFRGGDEVVHRDAVDHKMYVKEVIKRKVSVRTDVLDEDDSPVYVKKSRIEGILCYWFE